MTVAGRCGLALLACIILATGTWCALVVWFRFAAGETVRDALAGIVIVLTLLSAASLATSRRWRIAAVFAAVVCIIIGWWATITPSQDRNWSPEIARIATGTIDGDRLVIDNIRNFAWHSETSFEPRWERRTYDLADLADVDLIMSYWAGEAIAHTIVSFGFNNGTRLAFSIEIRKESDEPYSALAGFFKQYELAIVAADERDAVRLRTNIRGEDVRLYRLRITPANAQLLLREYIKTSNDLSQTPRFYNTLTANCTTLVFDMVRLVHPGTPWDPRIVLSGYLPNYVYDIGATDTSMPLERLRALSHIRDKAIAADASTDFSARIRDGVPIPH